MTIDDEGAVALLQRVLEIPSLSGEEREVAGLLVGAMRDLGFRAELDAAGNAVGSIGEGQKSVVVLGHMDTVGGWIEVARRNGALHGRGAVDAKGPLVAAVVAAARARPRLRVTVIGAVQEEASSAGARHLISLPPPDFLIIAEPGGSDSIVLGYKGSLRFSVRWEQACAHTAGAEPTAPERAVAFWSRLESWCAERSPGDGPFRRLTPRLVGMESGGDGLCEWSTLHAGMRLPPGCTVEETRRGIQALWPEAAFRFSTGEEPVLAPKNTPLVAGFLRSMRSQGLRPHFKTKTGTSDMNVVGPAWGCAMVAYGPGDSDLDHTPGEHIGIDEYLRGISVLTRALEEL